MTVPEIVGIGAALVAVIALVAALTQIAKVRRLADRLSAIPEDGSVFDALRRLDDDLAAAEDAIARLQPVVRSLTDRMPGAIRYTAVVRYDAHQDLAGQLSRSIAMLNEHGDGVVVTVMKGREEPIFYTKMIRGGRGTEQLSPEEQEAIRQALGR
ncbi:MAG: DUF4446 family protein [Actinobacteria bacterium]|nr:DUF4446 family protein [Actinomycetota bacterium]MBU1493625.1 DUF4446 family protein [Actinomycetota bacterium]